MVDCHPGWGNTPLYKVTLCAAQMGGFLAIFSLEMGPHFAEYSYMFPTFPRSGSQPFLFKTKMFGAKITFHARFDTVISKYFLINGYFFCKIGISTRNFFPRKGFILDFWAAHLCHSADLVPPQILGSLIFNSFLI